MIYKKIKLVSAVASAACILCITKPVYAETKQISEEIIQNTTASVSEEIVENEAALANSNENKDDKQKNGNDKEKSVKAAEEVKIERNWLTEEVASQLNKDYSKLTADDFLKIVKIDLGYKKIKENIPEEIKLLKNLQYLNLNYCRLSGDIPECIAEMPDLKHLDLGDNDFDSIPESLENKIINGDYAYCDVEQNNFKLKEGWHLLKGNWAYIDKYGERLKGEQKLKDISYNFGEEGYVKQGWSRENNIVHYYDRDAGMIKKSWKLIDNKWYYFNEDGVMLTGLQNIDGTKFCLSGDGVMLTGFQNIGGSNYYFCDRGGMQYGWVNVNGKDYYFDETTGVMAASTEKVINGKTYRFEADGTSHCDNNVWIDTYTYVTPNGQTVNTYYNYSHSNTNYQLFKYMTDPSNQASVDATAVMLHGGRTDNNCVYFASEALRRVGVGIPRETCNTYEFENILKSLGFVYSYDLTQLKPGDIVFTDGYTHVYIFMGWDSDGYAFIVDNQSYNFDNKILHRRQIYNDTAITDRATHFFYYPY
ncbi:MAG: leucine-rich repeat domain-containing protein [Clostridium sp.]